MLSSTLILLSTLSIVSCILRFQLKAINSDEFKSEVQSINAQNSVYFLLWIILLIDTVIVVAMTEAEH